MKNLNFLKQLRFHFSNPLRQIHRPMLHRENKNRVVLHRADEKVLAHPVELKSFRNLRLCPEQARGFPKTPQALFDGCHVFRCNPLAPLFA